MTPFTFRFRRLDRPFSAYCLLLSIHPTQRPPRSRETAHSFDEKPENTHTLIRNSFRVRAGGPLRLVTMLLRYAIAWAGSFERLRFIPVSPGSKKWTRLRSTYNRTTDPARRSLFASTRATT